MDIKQALTQYLTEPTYRFSKEEVERILEDELSKEDSEVDCEMIDLCVEVLARMENLKLPTQEEIPSFPDLVLLHKTKKRKKRKIVFMWAAVVAAEILFATTVVAAQVFDFDIVHYVVSFFSDGISVDFSASGQQTESYLPADTDLRKELADHGITPVLLPDKFIEGKKISVDYQSLLTCEVANIWINRSKRDATNIIIRQHIAEDFLQPIHYNGDLRETREVQAGDVPVLVMNFKDRRTITFSDGCTQYTINTQLDMETAIQLAESIQ